MIDREAFEAARKKVIGVDRKRSGIGTLSEKTVHAILKNYYEPDEEKQLRAERDSYLSNP